MGLSTSSKTVKPVYDSQITGAYDTAHNAYTANQGNVADTSNTLRGLGSSLIDRYKTGDPALTPAIGYNNDVLGGRYLTGNPNLQAIIDQTNGDVANDVNAHLGTRGQTGGSAQTEILARELAKNETGLRYQDYGDERNRMGAAAGMAPSLAGAQYLPLATGIGALTEGTNLPTDSANQFAAGVGGLLGQYTNTQSSDSTFNNIMKAIKAGGDVAKMFAGGA